MGTESPAQATVSGAEALEPFLETKIRLFIRDQNFRQQIHTILEKKLKFLNVASVQTGQSATEMVEKLSRLIITEDAMVVFAPPLPGKDSAAQNKLEALNQFLLNVQAKIRQTGKDQERIRKYMMRLVPVFEEAENYQMRLKFLLTLSEFRITSAFILPFAQSIGPQEQMEERQPVLLAYLVEHFTEKERRLEELDKKKTEMDLSARKEQVDKVMRQGEEYKRTGNYEEAVQCFNKAVELLPEDVAAYLESGRSYTKLKKYNRAIQRFTEAEEVANDIPMPNQEIASVRIIQVKEMIARGADPDGEQVAKLLDEAVGNYKNAMAKAQNLKPLHADENTDRAAEAVSQIAGSIFKLELGETLGSRNAAVKELGALARTSLEKAVKDPSAAEVPTSQLICMALADVDKGLFEEAEKHLFRAAEDKKYTLEACRELNYMGTQVRKARGPEAALDLYNRILKIDPPNKAAVHYNLSVAYHNLGFTKEAAGAIVQAVYTDPSLPNDDMFYKNVEVVSLMENLIGLFGKIRENDGKIPARTPKTAAPTPARPSPAMHTPPADPAFNAYRDRFEEFIRKDRPKAFKTLYDLYLRVPALLKSAQAYQSSLIMDMVYDALPKVKDSANPDLRRFGAFLGEIAANDAILLMPPDTRYADTLKELEATGDTASTIKKIYELSNGDRGFFAGPESLASPLLAQTVGNLIARYSDMQDKRIQSFMRLLLLYQKRREAFAATTERAETPPDEYAEMERSLSTDTSAAIAALQEKFAADPGFFDTPEAYASAALARFAETENRPGAPPGFSERMRAFSDRRRRYLECRRLLDESLEVLLATADQRRMANSIAQAIHTMPECVDKYYFYENGDVVSASKEIHMKLQGLGLKHTAAA